MELNEMCEKHLPFVSESARRGACLPRLSILGEVPSTGMKMRSDSGPHSLQFCWEASPPP